MKKILKRTLFVISTFIILFALFCAYNYFIGPLVRFYPKPYEFEANKEWMSADNKFYAQSNYDKENDITYLTGYIIVDDQKFNVEYNLMFRYRFNISDITNNVFLTGVDFRVDKDYNIILKKFDFFGDDKTKCKDIILYNTK